MYQKIQIFDTKVYGRILVLDGIIQITEKDEGCIFRNASSPSN